MDEPIAPSTSTMALSFADVQQRLPAGVTLEQHLGSSVLKARLKLVGPALGIAVGGVVWAAYGALAMDLGVLGAVAPGIVAGYLALAFILGRRRVILDETGLRVRTVPLPLPGDGNIAREELDAVDVVTVGVRSGRLSYRIDAVKHGQRRAIVTELVDEEQALVIARYLAQQLKLAEPTAAIQLS